MFRKVDYVLIISIVICGGFIGYMCSARSCSDYVYDDDLIRCACRLMALLLLCDICVVINLIWQNILFKLIFCLENLDTFEHIIQADPQTLTCPFVFHVKQQL